MSNDGGGLGAQGRLVGGRYRLIERIGSGGMGTVWRARDELVQREVAVKQPRLPGEPEDENHRRTAHRLHREARAAARVDHPSAVTIHDVVVEAERPDDRPRPTGPDELDAAEALDGLPWIVMELVRGESLHETLRRGPVEVPEAARIGLAVLGALRAAHSVGIVHRDVKPANVLLGPHRRVVLTDFGIAHVQGEDSLTASGESVGSLEFVAPERVSGRIAGPASDLWSLGVLLYAAVEGASPFRRTTPEATLAAILAAEPPEPEQAGPLGPLIVRLLARDPEQRPDAEEVAKALEAVTGRRSETEREPGRRPVTESVPGRRPETESVTGRWPVTESVPGRRPETEPVPEWRSVTEPVPERVQEAEDIPESAEDTGTPRLADGTTAQAKHHHLLRPGPLALLSALLVGGLGTATHLADTSNADTTEHPAGTTPAPTAPGPGGPWTAHREPDLSAVLHLPADYRRLAEAGSATDQPRMALYGDARGGTVQVRLLLWDRAPGSPMDEARKAHATWGEKARTQYTRTSVQAYDAAIADTTYQQDEDTRRVMQVMIRTDDGRMYELRVDMPKGTPEEQEGTSLFQGARDRLGIVEG
ncbi:serine/threonine-protein kinase [Streptomyces sp. SudanB52_2052]|uniref:serine/threonine-protein kinase n=1 Tax=Streptomyces sp. SudanB52_2052 TaxID=3035276 RepID=UPI003F56B037